jgi:phosphomannomutase
LYSSKKIIIADLDGTLSKSKTQMDGEMSGLLGELLKYKDFAVISGGSYPQFQKQFISGLSCPKERLGRLYLFPTCATSLYRFIEGKWTASYAEILSNEEKAKITGAFDAALKGAGYKRPQKVYGALMDDRGTQITFSACGSDAPLEVKSVWDPDRKKRMVIRAYLMGLLPEFEITLGGTTSIDVTRKGIDKRYGIRKIRQIFGYSYDQMLFLGDAIVEGGNDYPVKQEGIDCINVSGPEETKQILKKIIEESK